VKPTAYRVSAVIFDLDGTLTRPGALDFPLIKQELGCPPDMPVLEFIQAIESSDRRQAAMQRLERFEMAAAAVSRPNDGAEQLVAWIKSRNLRLGILTRNSRASVFRALENFGLVRAADFDLIVSRDDGHAPKPEKDGIVWMAGQWGVPAEQILMVGDFLFDVQAGRAAGTLTVLLDPDGDSGLQAAPCDFRIARLEELQRLIGEGLPLGSGKLPNDTLRAYLETFDFADASVLVSAGIGEDTAAVDVADSEVLILKSDPITFATDAIGQYAVLVNANDIVTAGARPRWFLTTLLLPRGTTASRIRLIMHELAEACRQWNITLCGGHTEISDAVNRPVVIGMMAGTVRKADLIEKKGMRPGDCVLVTKAVAVEGTAIVAREFDARLLSKGLSRREINTGKGFLDRISIVPEARLAAADRLASAMHDVTEGGLATALEELSIAGGHRIRVDLDRIPYYPETRKMCALLGLNPLGLIGSGSLLICCRTEHCDRLLERLRAAGIAATVIGQVMAAGSGIDARRAGQSAEWPHFDVDEITRLFHRPAGSVQ
jgi:HAD superfamily hydrolase (TIGR01509 family)